MNYMIFMDMAGDADAEFVRAHDIHYVPMEFSIGDEMHVSTGPESQEFMQMFYDGQRNGDLTKTTQITPFNYEEYFSTYLKEGVNCLYICLSSGLSSTYESALVAKSTLEEDYPNAKLYVLDSLTATVGMGMILEHAVKNRENGLSITENFEDLLKFRTRLEVRFMVQSLTYLHKGGRVSATTAIVGNALNIKPILMFDKEGRLITIGKKHGNRQAQKCLLDYFDEFRDPETEEAIYVVDSDAPELSDFLFMEAKKRYPEKEIRRTYLSPIIGAHVGPGLAAVVYARKE